MNLDQVVSGSTSAICVLDDEVPAMKRRAHAFKTLYQGRIGFFPEISVSFSFHNACIGVPHPRRGKGTARCVWREDREKGED